MILGALIPSLGDRKISEKIKALLIDHEAELTQLLKVNLEKSGRVVVEIQNDSTEALPTVREFQPDVILLDVVIPGMDGGDVQTQIESDSTLPKIPIIMLTALVDSAELSNGADAQSGSSVVLPKPVDLELLNRVINETLGIE